MPCSGCGRTKQFGNRILVKVTNWSETPMFLLGKASNTAYGHLKNGDTAKVYVRDIERMPEQFQRMRGYRR